MSPITTEVLDTGLGQPAEGVVVSLARLDEHDQPHPVGHGVTDAEGRVRSLVAPEAAISGRLPDDVRHDRRTSRTRTASRSTRGSRSPST